ncbi:MAG: ParB/RepB/Spo0J family partition protein [Proteobacteria bacterium]|nr:ParB/RepB/Spo0J family partition protein [Pseudomonadota bacterium]
MTAQKKVASSEFLYLPLESIIVEEQIRSGIDTESESFKALMESIKERGVLEPIIVIPKGDKYLLLCGERRFRAAVELKLETIPVRVMNAVTQKDEVLAYQLTENLQREDLNPIDQARGILAFVQARHPEQGYDVDGVMSDLIKYDRKPELVSDELVATVATALQISGKSTKTLFNGLSLLKLPPEIQAEIQSGNLPVSQGYLFAANLDCPDRAQIFEATMKKPVTNATLENMLTVYKKVKPDPGVIKLPSMTKQVASLRSIESFIEKGAAKYTKPDLVTLLDELRVFCALVELRIPIAPEPAPEKKKPPQV